jgi:protein deglycase
MMNEKKVLVPLADGFEEIEAVTVIDILRRAGATVVSAGLTERHVCGGHGIRIETDVILEDVLKKKWSLIVLPGGEKGVENLLADPRVTDLLQKHHQEGKIIGAICAAPRILDKAGITNGKKITIHPTQIQYLKNSVIVNKPVIESGTLITGRSAGAAMAFSLTLVRKLFGEAAIDDVEKGVLTGVTIGG